MTRLFTRPLVAATIALTATGATFFALPAINVAGAEPVSVLALPDVDTVLANCVKAAGGQEAIDKIKTLHVKSNMSMMGMQMNMDQSWSRDGGRLVIMTMPMGEMISGTDGETAWTKTPMGYALATDEQEQQIESQSGMFMFMIDPKSFAKDDLKALEVVGEEEFGGKKCYKLHFTSRDDNDGHVFFEIDSGMPVGFMQQDGEEGDKMTMTLGDWKEIEGVKFFHLMSMEMTPGKDSPMGTGPDGKPMKMQGELKVESLKVNSLDENHFALPEEVKKMLAEKPEVAEDGEPAAEIKLEELSPEMQAQAKRMVDGAKNEPSMIPLILGQLEKSKDMPGLPADQQKFMQYLIQELKKVQSGSK